MIFTGTGNANKIGGIPVQIGTPSDTFTLLYDAASRRWIFGPSGTPPAGGVGGSANLITIGSVPFVTSAGVLGQSANLFWDNANARLEVGPNANGSIRAAIVSTTASSNGTAPAGLNGLHTRFVSSIGYIEATEVGVVGRELRMYGHPLRFGNSNSSQLFTTLDQNGTFTLYNETPTTGSTSFVVRAGAGQTGNLFSVRNASNVEQFWVNAFGPEANNFIAVTRFRTNSNEVGIEATSGLDLALNRLIRYSSTTDYSGTKDLSLSRASANVIQVGDGGANSNGTILARLVQSAGVTVASLPAAAAGNAGTISYVTDSNSTTIGATVAGGGANRVLVWSNGTAWRIFAN